MRRRPTRAEAADIYIGAIHSHERSACRKTARLVDWQGGAYKEHGRGENGTMSKKD